MDEDVDVRIDELLDSTAGVEDPGAVLGGIDHPRCRWADVNASLRDPHRLPPLLPDDQPIGDVFRRWMIYSRGEQHHQLRARFSGYFGPRQAETFRQTVEVRVDALLAELAPRGEMDVVTDLARRVTFPLICDTMGVPEADRAELARLIARFEELVPRQRDAEAAAEAEAAAARIMDLFEGYFADRLERPREDFLGDLVREPLGDHEEWRDIAANCMFLLSNAVSNTPTLVAGTLGLVIDHPDVREAFLAREVTPEQVAHESVRLLSPVTYALSADGADEGWEAYYLAAANRDPEQFPDPNRFDPSRSPNRHLSFFVGRHACLGSAVATMIAGVTADRVLRALPGLRRSGPWDWASAIPLHRLGRLPVAWDARP